MTVRYPLQEGGVALSQPILRSNKLSLSSAVVGAFTLTQFLQGDGLSVHVRLHLQVCEYEQLFTTVVWNVTPLPFTAGAAHLLLKPLPAGAPPILTVMKLRRIYPGSSEGIIEFFPKMGIEHARRLRLAAEEAKRLCA